MLKKILLFLLKPIVWVLLFLVVEATIVNVVILNPARLKTNLAKHDIYPKMIVFVGDYIAGLMEKSPEKNDIPPDQIAPLIRESIEPLWLKGETEKALDSIFAYADNESAILSLSFDLKPLKQTLPEKINNYFAKEYQNLKPCTQQEEKNLFENNNQIDEISCKPSFMAGNLEFTGTKSGSEIGEVLKDIPDTYDLAPVIAKNQDKIENYKAGYQQYHKFYNLLVIALAIAIVILLLLHLPQWVSAFKTLSNLLMSVGFLTALSGAIPKLIFLKALGNSSTELIATFSALLTSAYLSIGITMIVISAIFYFANLYLSSKNKIAS